MSDQHRTSDEQATPGSHGYAGWQPPQPPRLDGTSYQSAPESPYSYPAPAEPPTQGGFDGSEPPNPPEAGSTAPQGGHARRGLLKGRLALVAAVATIAALLGGVTGGVIAERRDASASSSAATIVSPVSINSNGTANISAIAAAVSPSVVQIVVKTSTGTSTGTGVILTPGGQILTNFHVISGAVNGDGQMTVTFKDGSTVSGSVTGTDKALDVAVVTAAGVSGLTPATLGNSAGVAVGDQVVAIGNPEGLTGTVTSGIISAENRQVSVQVDEGSTRSNGGFGFPNLPGLNGLPGRSSGSSSGSSADTATYKAFQTDAALNPGNSGGPLINANGQVIGLNSAMYSSSNSNSTADTSAGSVGLGFAIPINDIKQVLPKLQAGQNL
ncbi:trypsin-like peptidase domain-containing protein [Kitasatospora sp. MAP5-34]|uniref:S1C family serine protease n=1 Tax=Kitasatospora sp. MAP5-34 TaxID=3035102 RepID=UPI00247365E2|nr:trypsin-like peptidase domain-containing protein [Kitasatospora sp. MAP5-34]MDH6579585.1 putative serine protease PepD [Kitasatospora sp. MAP5-34]